MANVLTGQCIVSNNMASYYDYFHLKIFMSLADHKLRIMSSFSKTCRHQLPAGLCSSAACLPLHTPVGVNKHLQVRKVKRAGLTGGYTGTMWQSQALKLVPLRAHSHALTTGQGLFFVACPLLLFYFGQGEAFLSLARVVHWGEIKRESCSRDYHTPEH